MAGITGKNFWTDINLEPKRKYKFYVELGPLLPEDNPTGLDFWLAKSITKPSFTVGETPHKVLNHTFYYPGKVEWNTVECVMVDPGGNFDTSQGLVDILTHGGYRYPDQGETYMLTKKGLAKNLNIYQFAEHYQQGGDAPDEQLLEKWTLKNAWIQDVKFGDLAYDAEEMVDVTVTFRYDWAVIESYKHDVSI
jgi:hypothetical protein